VYLRTEPIYADLYKEVWTYADWARVQGLDGRDTGIDLVAQTRGTEEFHAIQCKFYEEGHRITKVDIDSFFTASGQKPFTHRIIVSTTNDWTENAELALFGQNPPVTKIDLHDLEISLIDWSRYQPAKAPVLKAKKTLRKHQTSAVLSVTSRLIKADRGKLIMACGTGKTFTSLKIAEQMAGPGGRILFLVPSLSLLSQVLTEWTQESGIPLHSFAVCSDSEVGKKRKRDEDVVETFAHELRYPATTDARHLAVEFIKRQDGTHLNVVFSTSKEPRRSIGTRPDQPVKTGGQMAKSNSKIGRARKQKTPDKSQGQKTGRPASTRRSKRRRVKTQTGTRAKIQARVSHKRRKISWDRLWRQ
jgi:predicted helicase